MRIAAVVVTYNRKELLRECLRAVMTQSLLLDETIIVDNASTDCTCEMVESEFPDVTYMKLSENLGGAGGFHEGMRIAYEKGHDWIWVMDDDALPASDALEHLVLSGFCHENDVYSLASGVFYTDGSISSTHRRFFDPTIPKEILLSPDDYQADSVEVDIASFVGMLISRRAIREVGLPRKDFFIYYDDIEYSLRIRDHGGRILTIPGSRICHRVKGVKRQSNNQEGSLNWRSFYHRRNRLYTYRRYMHPNLGFYARTFMSVIKDQAYILVNNRSSTSSKILWWSLIDGLRGKLGRTIVP